MTEYRIRSGVSTRTVQLTTGELVNFSREALESAAEQAAAGFIPMGVEHLSYLPPRGRITRAEIETDAEGQADLVVYGQDLKFLRAGDLSLVSGFPSTADQGQPLSDVTIGVEPRNYPPEVWQEIISRSPLPVIEKANWSGLPALIYTLSIPVVWGAIKFAGSFFERLGAAAADGLV